MPEYMQFCTKRASRVLFAASALSPPTNRGNSLRCCLEVCHQSGVSLSLSLFHSMCRSESFSCFLSPLRLCFFAYFPLVWSMRLYDVVVYINGDKIVPEAISTT